MPVAVASLSIADHPQDIRDQLAGSIPVNADDDISGSDASGAKVMTDASRNGMHFLKIIPPLI